MTVDEALQELALEELEAQTLNDTISQLSRKIGDLERALASRALIGRAVGLTMSKYTLDSDTAFAFLVRQSQDSNTKLRDICRALVTDADSLAHAD